MKRISIAPTTLLLSTIFYAVHLVTTQSYALPHSSPARVVPPSCRGAAKVAAAALPEVVLDIDGDGVSDIITYSSEDETTSFQTRQSGSGIATTTIPATGTPVLGDYDGDGITDFAVVHQEGQRLTWTVRRSSSSELVTQQFGQQGDTVLYGCTFIRQGYAALAVVRGTRILAYDLLSGDSRVFNFSALSKGEVIGCGDVTADGLDEPLLVSPGSSTRYTTFSALGCEDEILAYRTLPAMTSQGIIKRPTLSFPLVIASRPTTGARYSIDPRSVSDFFPTSRFLTPRKSTFSSGSFLDSSGELTPAVVWLEQTTRTIKRRLLTEGRYVNEVIDIAPPGAKLVAPQGLVKP
jgi:hypothetical protein